MLCTSKEQLCEDSQALCNGVLVLSLLHGGLLAWWGRREPWSECAHDSPVVVTRHLVAFWIWSVSKEEISYGGREERSRWAWPPEVEEHQNWVYSDEGGIAHLRERGHGGGWSGWTSPSLLLYPCLQYTFSPVFPPLRKNFPDALVQVAQDFVWLASFNAEYWRLGCLPHLSCVFCLRLDPWGSVLPRGESRSSLGVFCAANLSRARGEWKDVAFLCVTEEPKVALDVAVMLL